MDALLVMKRFIFSFVVCTYCVVYLVPGIIRTTTSTNLWFIYFGNAIILVIFFCKEKKIKCLLKCAL